MDGISRRDSLKLLGGTAAAGLASTASVSAHPEDTKRGKIEKLGQVSPDIPRGGLAEGDIRDDGMYGLHGTRGQNKGSYLVDLSDPKNPQLVHKLDGNNPDAGYVDVKFGTRKGLYYRSEDGRNAPPSSGVEIVDYGYDQGSPESPQVIGKIETGGVHNVFPHPNEDVLYVTNLGQQNGGLEIWDVSDPKNPKPSEKGQYASTSSNLNEYLHDITADAERGLLHGAYIGGFSEDWLDAYATFDISDPLDPQFLGMFDYADHPDYEEVGKAGFEMCHYADFDPKRKIAIVGDEVSTGVPGGKHIFDIGWDEGSPSDPKHIGFTHSPNAEVQSRDEAFYWTTHNHDVVVKDKATLLVGGDYHEGVVVYDISDPTDPKPASKYNTDDNTSSSAAPFCWGADYNPDRDLVYASDSTSGGYTFRVTDEEVEHGDGGDGKVRQDVIKAIAGDDGVSFSELQQAVQYWINDTKVGNTGKKVNFPTLQKMITMWASG